MPISDEITKKIVEYAISEDPDKMVPYLKEQLVAKTLLANDLFEYARAYRFQKKPNKPYVINAGIINKLGVAVGTLDSLEEKRLNAKFFILAAERGSAWGCRNCVSYFLEGDSERGIDRSIAKALEFANKAVEFASPNEKHEHKYELFLALRANNKKQEANTALVEYLAFKVQKFTAEKNAKSKEKLQKEIEKIIATAKNILEEFQTDFSTDIPDAELEAYCTNRLEEIEPFLKPNIDLDEFRIIQQEAHCLKAQYLEVLKHHALAMQAFCKVTDTKHPVYIDAINGRSRLLKQQVTKANGVDTESESSESEDDTPKNLFLPRDIPLPTQFSKTWKKEADWFDSVNDAELQHQYEKRLSQLDCLISAKQTEIDLIKESAKNTANLHLLASAPQIAALEEELEKLENTKEQLTKRYEAHLPEKRKVFRRHAAESRFFNPRRSGKRAAITELTHAIIDQRFQLTAAPQPPLNLQGRSTRLFITAERSYQEATLTLRGEHRPRNPLGIPPTRSKAWSNGNGEERYGPVERYQVSGTEIQSEHRTSPKRNRIGDSFLPQHGTYNNDIYPFLIRLSDNERNKEQQIATWMIRYGRNHQGVTLEELKLIYEDADGDDVDHFNRVCFLVMAKEQVQWHSAVDQNYHLGMMVSQARCLIMIEAGFISFAEAFKNNVLFGIYSKTGILDNPDTVAEACDNIDMLYLGYLQIKNPQEYLPFIKSTLRTFRIPVLTRQQAHLDLQYVHGGNSDTEDEGYRTSLSI